MGHSLTGPLPWQVSAKRTSARRMRCKLADLVLDVCDLRFRTRTHVFAGDLWRDPQGQQFLDLFEREAELFRSLDKAEARDGIERVVPKAARGGTAINPSRS